MEGRRGPVHLTIPHDLQESEVDEKVFERFEESSLDDQKNWLTYPNPKQIEKCLDLLKNAKKPIILAGLGAGATVSEKDLDKFLINTDIPFMGVDTGRGLVGDSHPNSLGIGYIPLNKAAQRLNECDVILLLGVKLDYQLGFGGSPPFNNEKIIISVDPEISQINRPRTVNLAVNCDVGPFVEKISDKSEGFEWNNGDWLKSLKETKKTYLNEMDSLAAGSLPMHPMEVSKAIREYMDEDTFVVFDGGDYCHYSRATVPVENYLRSMYVSSFGMIGVGLPYAIGAKAALPDKNIILEVGDGSFGFDVPEIDTSVRHNLPITIIVGNNSLWGIDYWIQKGLYDRDIWTKLDQTNYELIAKGFGANGSIVDNPIDLKKEIQRSLNSNKISLINTIVEKVSSPVADAAVSRKLGTHG